MSSWKIGMLTFGAIVFLGVVALFLVEFAHCADGLCGNKCFSSADCMSGCVCMQEDPPNLGVCVSFN